MTDNHEMVRPSIPSHEVAQVMGHMSLFPTTVERIAHTLPGNDILSRMRLVRDELLSRITEETEAARFDPSLLPPEPARTTRGDCPYFVKN